MSFYRKLEKLQNSEEAQGKIVIVRCGAFFVSIGKDAVVLSLLLGLNVNCLNIGVCKVGIPVKYMMKYIDELEKILYISKVEKNKRIYYLNIIDTKLNCQRIFLRIMQKQRWIDEKKYKVAFEYLLEIGKIVGGLIKTYGKNIEKRI